MLAVCVLATGCASGSGASGCAIGFGVEIENRAAIERFEALRDRFFVRHLLFNPVTATYLGADGYSDVLQSTNGALKDYSEAALARELAFYRESQQELQGIARESLPPHASSRSSRDGRAAEVPHPPDRRAEISPARRRHLHHRAVSRHRLADAADAGSRQRPARHRSRVGARCQQGRGDSRIPRPGARESSRRQAGGQRARLADGAAERRRIERRKRGVLPAHPCRHRLWLRRQPAVRTDADAAVETGRRPGCRVVGCVRRVSCERPTRTTRRIVLPRAPKSTNGASGMCLATREARNSSTSTARSRSRCTRASSRKSSQSSRRRPGLAPPPRAMSSITWRKMRRGTMTSCLRGIARPRRAPSRTAASTACSTCPRTTSSTFCRRRRSFRTASTPRTTWRRRSRNRAWAASISRRRATTRQG